MSHENPGDGIRCDHCNRTPRQAKNPDYCADRLLSNRHERLCHRCFNHVIDQELAEIRENTPVTVIAAQYRYSDYRKPKRRKKS